MKTRIARVVFLTASVLCLGHIDSNQKSLVVIDSSSLSVRDMQELTSSNQALWWVQGADEVLVAAKSPLDPDFKSKTTMPYRDLSTLSLVCGAHSTKIPSAVKTLFRSGRCAVLSNADTKFLRDDGHNHFTVKPLVSGMTLSERVKSQPSLWSDAQKSRASQAISEVDGERWFADVRKLALLNRYIAAPGNLEARDFFQETFQSLGLSQVTTQEFAVRGRKAWNVIAHYNSEKADASTVLVTGHYDSTSQNTGSAAPGAEDNASGSAGVIELARVVVAVKPNVNVIFIAFSGEEQGLVGSEFYSKQLTMVERSRIKAVVNMDMIGYSKNESLDVLLETSSAFKNLSNHFAEAATHAKLNVFRSYNPFGSDHMPFIDKSIPALLTIDNDWDDYPSYHRTTDTIDKVSQEMGTEILKMNAAAIVAF